MSTFNNVPLNDEDFGPNSGTTVLRSFDAFPKTKSTYTSATEAGGRWTVLVLIICTLMTITELKQWIAGTETHHFSVERGVGHELQLNLDVVIAMRCEDLHVNVQDASMDRIMAGELLTKEETNFHAWATRGNSAKGHYTSSSGNSFDMLGEDDLQRRQAQEEDSHVHHVLGHMRESRSRKKFQKAPRLRSSEERDACRIYGSLEGNKVQGDFHITARGHGYLEPGLFQHLDHSRFNFSHHINELSFGPHYPNLLNPLDRTSDTTDKNFYKFQYYLSIVPTVYTKRRVSTRSGALDPAAIPQPATLDAVPDEAQMGELGTIPEHVTNPLLNKDTQSIFTNQYAATTQSREVSHEVIPGIFFKYDIEPILLIVSAQRSSFWSVVVKLVNVISGIVVGGGWMFQLSEWASDLLNRRRRRTAGDGLIHGGLDRKDEKFG